MMSKRASTKTDNQRFPGFDIPRQNWFKLPNNWTDLTAAMGSWAEQKVVEYVLHPEAEWLVGKELWFTREIKKGKWIHKGVPGGHLEGTEVWERIEQ